MTERTLHEWTIERLSDHVDGGLSGSELEAVERHLETCEVCRHVREDLQRVAGAARLLGPIEPATDLWPGLQSRIAAPDTRRASARPMSPPLLAAAAVVLIAISASLAWWGRGALGEASVMAGSDVGSSPTSVRAAAAGPDGPVSEALATELERLESVIADSRDRLEPGTVHVLERNLVLIERAIEDSYRALALDPENDFIRGHLERTYERKLEYLREIASIVERAG